MAEKTSVFGINETFTKPVKLLYANKSRRHNVGYFGLRHSPNPIFWDKDEWQYIEGRVQQLHGRSPRYKLWPGFNDARYITVVKLRHRGTGQVHVFINTHWVPEGPKVPGYWRDNMRVASKQKVARVIHNALDDGYVVWFMGDTNINGRFNFNPRIEWVKPEGIDKIGLQVPPGTEIRRSDFTTPRAPTDHHDGVVAKVTLVKFK